MALAICLGWTARLGASDCMQWVRREDVGSPGVQHRHCMAFSEARGTVVLYSADESSDLWEYDGRVWQRIETTGARPPARLDAGLLGTRGLDHGGVLLVAGYSRTPLGDDDEHRLDDIWHFVFDGPFVPGTPSRGRWRMDGRLSGAATPAQTPQITTRYFEEAPRANVRLVFGPDGPLVFGGMPKIRVRSGGGAVDETFDGPAHFVHRLEGSISIPTFIGAFAATEMAVAHDTRRERVLHHGGVRFLHHDRAPYVETESDLRVYSENPLRRQFLTNLPPRFGHRMVYDPRRDRLVVFGGSVLTDGGSSPSKWNSQLVDARRFFEVELDGNTLQDPVTDAIPAARWGHDMVYNSRRGVVVLYGGWNGIPSSLESMPRETWEYRVRLFQFLEQPRTNVVVCDGNPFELSVRVLSHATPKYQWYLGNNSIRGETNRTLVRTSATAQDEGVYRCEATDACGNQLVSESSIVAVHFPPFALAGAPSMAVCPGETASTTFGVLSSTLLTVTWFRFDPDANGDPSNNGMVRVPSATELGIPGTWDWDLVLPDMQPAQNGFYRARAVNLCGETWSDVAMLTAGAWIRAHPQSITNRVCTPQSLRVVAAGKGELKYQWRRNGLPLESDTRVVGTRNPVLFFSTLRYLDDGAYDCVVSDSCTTVTSRVAQVTIEPNPPFVRVETNGPAARMRHAMAYDSVRGVTVLFGGVGSGGTVSEVYRNDTWEYDGEVWTRRLTTRAPNGRTDFGMAFDRDRGRVVLFGGFTHNGINGNLRSGETWEYDGRDWTLRMPTNAPLPRAYPTLFYDPVRKVTMLYGGDSEDPVNPRAGDLWAWDGTNWVQRVVEGERPRFGTYGSPARPQMVWDEARGYAVLPPTSLNQGGIDDWATWLWDGVRWSRRAYTFAGFGVTPSTAGSGMGMVYDSYRREVVYWGGDGSDQSRLWRWTGEIWRRDDISEDVGFELNMAAAYDVRRGSIVQFGGQYSGPDPDASGLSARTWERVLADAPVILREPVVHRPASPDRLLVRLVAAGAGPITYEWQRDSVPLAEGGVYTGTKTATLSVDPSLASDAGNYRCLVRTPCAELASQAVRLGGGGAGLALAAASLVVEGQATLRLTWDAPGARLEQSIQFGGPWNHVTNATSPYLVPLEAPAAFFRIWNP